MNNKNDKETGLSTERACQNGACSLCSKYEVGCTKPEQKSRYLDNFSYKRLKF